jgi:hypothetical protein
MSQYTISVQEPIETYTDNHFMNKLNTELENIRKSPPILRINKLIDSQSNSPISMSSDSENSCQELNEDDNNDCFEESIIKDNMSKSHLRKLTFREVQESIDKYYDTNERTSSELDVLAIFLKGQKQMYMKASDIMLFKTYFVLIPASISSLIVIFLWFFSEQYYEYISGLNVSLFVLYFLNVFFKWDSYAFIYRDFANKFDRIFNSLDTSFIESDREQVLIILQKTEEKLKDLVFDIPWECRYLFPILSNINLFTFIKRIEIYKKNLIMKFKDIKNEIRYIQYKWGDSMSQKEKSRFHFLCSIKEKIKTEILHYKKAYSEMENFITKEIHISNSWVLWSKRKNISDNPVVASYLSTIFVDD